MSATKPRVLMVVHRVPYPPDKGDRIRSYQALRFLARRSDVHLATLADEPLRPETVAELQRLTQRLFIAPIQGPRRWLRGALSVLNGGTLTDGLFYSPELRDELERWLREFEYDAIYCFSSAVARYVLGRAPLIADLVDVDSEKWLQYAGAARPPLSWLFRLEGQRLRRLEISLASTCRAVTLVTEPEAAFYRGFCPAGPVRVVSNGVDLDYFRPRAAANARGLVFVGALDYRPNVQGIDWFVKAVWPALHKELPETTLTIVGRKPAAAVRALAGVAGVRVVGAVPDVRPYLADAAVAIAPLRIGRGVQNKVLEALAMGKAVAATPPAAEGLGIRHREHALILPDDEWAPALKTLLSDPLYRNRLGQAGRTYVETHHDWNRCLQPLEELLQAPVQHARQHRERRQAKILLRN